MNIALIYSFFVSFGVILFFATWDRMESLALGAWLLSLTMMVAGGLSFLKKEEYRVSLLDGLLLLFLGYIGGRAYYSPVELYGRMDLSLVLLSGVAWFGLPLLDRGKLELWKKCFLGVLFLLTLANVGCSYYQSFVDSRWGLFIERTESASHFLSGVFSHYNYFSNVAMLSVFVGIAGLYSWKNDKKWLCVSGIVVILNVVLLVMANSRGVMIASLLGLMVLVGLCIYEFIFGKEVRTGQNRKTQGFLVVAVLVILGGVLWISFVSENRGWFYADGSVNDNGRRVAKAIAVDQVIENPMIGSGARSFEWKSTEFWPDYLWQGTKTMEYVHNEFYQLTGDYGVVGLGLFLASLLGVVGVFLYRVIVLQCEIKDNIWCGCALAALVSFLTHCFFSFPAHIPACLVSVLIFVKLGLLGNEKFTRGLNCIRVPYIQPVLVMLLGGLMFLLFRGEASAFALYVKENDTHRGYYTGDFDELEQRKQSVADIVEIAPNHKRLECLGYLSWNAYLQAPEEQKKSLLDESLGYYAKAVKLYPMSPHLRTAYAVVLSKSGDYKEAEVHFDYAITVGRMREYWTNASWHYARHCFERATSLWGSREPYQAYDYFKRCQLHLSRMHGNRFGEQRKLLAKKVKVSIEVLENAGFARENKTETFRLD